MEKLLSVSHQILALDTRVFPLNHRIKNTRVNFLGVRVSTLQKNHRSVTAREALPIVAAASSKTFRIIIQGRHLEVTGAIKDYVEKKISKALSHYDHTINLVDIYLSARGGDTGTKGPKSQRTEVTIHTLRNGMIRSEESAETLYASIDLVCDKIERKLQKVKEKAIVKGKWPGRSGEKGGAKISEIEGEPIEIKSFDEEELFPPEIVRTKLFKLEAMSPEEAALKMEQLDHSFYLYEDLETKAVRVVYKRKEHGYGVIIPVKE